MTGGAHGLMTALEAGEGEGLENSRSLDWSPTPPTFLACWEAISRIASGGTRRISGFLGFCERWSRDACDLLRFVVDVASLNATSASIGCEAPAAAGSQPYLRHCRAYSHLHLTRREAGLC